VIVCILYSISSQHVNDSKKGFGRQILSYCVDPALLSIYLHQEFAKTVSVDNLHNLVFFHYLSLQGINFQYQWINKLEKQVFFSVPYKNKKEIIDFRVNGFQLYRVINGSLSKEDIQMYVCN
jgi:hypothetical protein